MPLKLIWARIKERMNDILWSVRLKFNLKIEDPGWGIYSFENTNKLVWISDGSYRITLGRILYETPIKYVIYETVDTKEIHEASHYLVFDSLVAVNQKRIDYLDAVIHKSEQLQIQTKEMRAHIIKML